MAVKCPKCQFENADGIKFCGDCGAGLERMCPQCNFRNAPGIKFCGDCGQALTEISPHGQPSTDTTPARPCGPSGAHR